MTEIKIKGSVIYILPVIHALKGEEKKVRAAFEKIKPDCIAIAIPPEDLEIIGKMDGKEEPEMSLQHQYYLLHLSSYGEISLPPRDIMLAHEMAMKKNIPLKAVDVDDMEYAELLTQHVSLISLIRHSRKIKKLGKRKFRARNAEEFVMEWDREVNSIKDFREMEEEREEKMISNIIKLCHDYKKILAIFPLEKYERMIFKLERYKK